MPTCCMCDEDATATTAVVDGESFQVCRTHLLMWQRTPEDINLRDWCRRVTTFGIEIGKSWARELLASGPLPGHDEPRA